MDAILDTFWQNLFGVGSSSGAIYGFVEAILVDMRKVAAVLVTIFMGYKVMLYFSDMETRLDPFVIIKPLIFLFVLSVYSPLVDMLVRVPMEIVDDIIDQHINHTEADFEDAITHVDDGSAAGPGQGLFDILAINPTLELIHLLIYLASTMVAYYMMFRQIILIAIYYIVGTIALPFSLIAGNQDTARNWYLGFIAVMMWKPMLKIMQGIIIALDPAAVSFTNALFSVALQIVMILTILQIPKFANLVVSKGSDAGSDVGGKFMSSVGKIFKGSK